MTIIPMSNTEIDLQAQKAREAGQKFNPHIAKRVWYDVYFGDVCVELVTGIKMFFPRKLLQGLENATPEQLLQVKLSPGGTTLSWRCLDVDLGIPELVNGVFGTQAWMEQLQLDK